MKKNIVNILSVIFGLLLINGGLDKLLHYMPVPENLSEELVNDFNALAEISWLMPLIAIAEITGGVFIIFQKTRALGVLIVLPVMTGVLLTHIFVDPGQVITAIVIWIILLWIIYQNREKYIPLIK